MCRGGERPLLLGTCSISILLAGGGRGFRSCAVPSSSSRQERTGPRKEERRRLGRLHIFAMMERVRLPSVRTSSVGLLRVGFLVSLLVFRFLSLSLAFVASFVRSTARCYDIFAPPTNKGRAGKEKKNRPRPVLLLSICPICRVCCVCCLFFRPVASVHLSEPPAVSSYTQPASHLRFYALQVCLFRAWACFFLL